MHLWAYDGLDHWKDSGWKEGLKGKNSNRGAKPSGVCIPQGVLDDFVVMRFAELIDERKGWMERDLAIIALAWRTKVIARPFPRHLFADASIVRFFWSEKDAKILIGVRLFFSTASFLLSNLGRPIISHTWILWIWLILSILAHG